MISQRTKQFSLRCTSTSSFTHSMFLKIIYEMVLKRVEISTLISIKISDVDIFLSLSLSSLTLASLSLLHSFF